MKKKAFWGRLFELFLTITLGPLVLALCFGLLFLFPVSFIVETWDVVHMRGTTSGTVTAVNVVRGGHGTSRPDISYAYVVNAAPYSSNRYMTGFINNRTTWSGGGGTARDYAPGKSVTVHYDPSAPAKACLEYGWGRWSVGFPCFLYGMALMGWSSKTKRPGRRSVLLGCAGFGAAAYGFGMLALGPNCVRPAELHWHALAVVGTMPIALAWFLIASRRTARGSSPTE